MQNIPEQPIWKYGTKMFVFNLATFVALAAVGSLLSCFTSNQGYFLILLAVGGATSISYWVAQGRRWKGRLSSKFKVALIGSAFYWLMALMAVIGGFMTDDFWVAGGLFVFTLVSAATAVFCSFFYIVAPSSKGGK